ncbi:MAG: hypothetical protein ACI898_000322 [Flavobacteriales bacterium]|jgi:hypothetical protein
MQHLQMLMPVHKKVHSLFLVVLAVTLVITIQMLILMMVLAAMAVCLHVSVTLTMKGSLTLQTYENYLLLVHLTVDLHIFQEIMNGDAFIDTSGLLDFRGAFGKGCL